MAITLGSPKEIDSSAAADCCGFTRLDDDTVIAFYNDSTTQLSARILDITRATQTITTVGSQQDLRAQAYQFRSFQIVELAPDKYLFWGVGAGLTDLSLAVINHSGGTLTYVSAGELIPADENGMQAIDNNQMVRLTSTTALIVYPDGNAGNQKARVISIDGSDNVSEGTAVEVSDDFDDWQRIYAFSPTQALYVYIDDFTTTDHMRGRILNISGTTITPQTAKDINTARDWNEITLSGFDTSRAVVVGTYTTDGEFAYILTLSGNTFNIGAEQALDIGATSTTFNFRSTAPNNSTMVTIWEDGSNDVVVSELLVNLATDLVTLTNTTTITDANILGNHRYRIFSFHSSSIIVGHYKSFDATVGSTATATSSGISHLWITEDKAVTWTDIGDTATWLTNLVGAVMMKPLSNKQVVWAMVGTTLYKTTNKGLAWAPLATVGYEADFIDLLDGDMLFIANRVSGGDPASLVDGTSGTVTHINTGKSTSGGATDGSGVA